MNAQLHIERSAGLEAPDDESFRLWVSATCEFLDLKLAGEPELSLKISDIPEMTKLNQRFRDRSGPTNVLSFPAELPDDIECALLGDIVICAPLVQKEAREQGKTSQCHWAHLTIHGVLHLLGYDHHNDDTAQVMENLEIQILEQLGCPDPYIPGETAASRLAL